MKIRKIDLRWAILGSISRKSKQRGRFTGPTLNDIKKDLKQRYDEEFSDSWILQEISELEGAGLVRRARGLLRNGREALYTTNRGEDVVLTLIKLNEREGFVHDGWEGIVCDPPSVEDENPKTTNTGSLLLCGLTFGITVTLLSLAINHERVAQQIQKDAILLYPEESKSNIGKKANTLTYAGDYLY